MGEIDPQNNDMTGCVAIPATKIPEPIAVVTTEVALKSWVLRVSSMFDVLNNYLVCTANCNRCSSYLVMTRLLFRQLEVIV